MSTVDMDKPAMRFVVAVLVTAMFCLLYWLCRPDILEYVPENNSVTDIAFAVFSIAFLLGAFMRRSIARLGFSLAVTGLVCFGAWYVWNETPRWLRRTEFSDFSYFASLVLMFFALSVLNPVILWIWGKLNDGGDTH